MNGSGGEWHSGLTAPWYINRFHEWSDYVREVGLKGMLYDLSDSKNDGWTSLLVVGGFYASINSLRHLPQRPMRLLMAGAFGGTFLYYTIRQWNRPRATVFPDRQNLILLSTAMVASSLGGHIPYVYYMSLISLGMAGRATASIFHPLIHAVMYNPKIYDDENLDDEVIVKDNLDLELPFGSKTPPTL